MDDRGSSAMDASPVARVKRAVTTLKDDIKVRVGGVEVGRGGSNGKRGRGCENECVGDY